MKSVFPLLLVSLFYLGDFGSIAVSTLSKGAWELSHLATSGSTCVAAVPKLTPVKDDPPAGFDPGNIQVSASSDDGNVPANTLDGDLGTRWSALGDNQYITYDLSASFLVSGLDIAFYQGDQRLADIVIQTSNDNSNWSQVWSGRQPTLTTQLQRFDFPTTDTRYVRIVGFGNTVNDWNSITEVEFCVTDVGSTLVDAHLAYGGSAFGQMVATDKSPLHNDETAGFANYSSYPLGINRVIIDIADLPDDGAGISADDFSFRIGNDDAPVGWGDAPDPTGVSLAAGAGEDGSDRVTITWDDYAITNTWLQVTVLWNADTGLLDDEVFYFGHASCEGNSPLGNLLAVNFFDVMDAFYNQTAVGGAEITNVFDFNRDETVNFLDAIAAYLNMNSQVQLITPAAPFVNIELIDWYLSVPTDEDGNGRSDSIDEVTLASGYTDPRFFYTASDGGIVFKNPIAGFKTSDNTSYTRVELREMLRRGDTSIPTKGVNANNWVFGSAPQADINAAGGVDGTLTGTLAVNHVSTTGDSGQVGRVVVAQIHANDDEPCRLYYRKLPGNSKGSIYFAHEPIGANDVYYEMIGSRSSSQPDPADGVALDEKWSYEIKTVGNLLTVTIIRSGKPDLVEMVDMSGSGYDAGGQYMFFKAGAYIQDSTGDADDYAQVTYYALDNQHP